MPRQNRFVIKNADGKFFSHCDVAGTKEIIEKDFHGNRTVYDRHLLEPKFSDAASAVKFDVENDAAAMMSHEHLKDSAAFDGCTVEIVDE
jgi:hypothetical protein